MSRAFAVLVAVGFSALCTSPAISAQIPARDKPEPAGTSVIRGRIVDAASGEPVRKARVRASNPTVLPNGRAATTDANGRYELKTLPAGQYTVSAVKPNFVTVSYGQTRPLEAGKLIDVAEGQTVDRIDLKLSRTGVITGRITDEFGEPMAAVQVSAVRFQFINGSRRSMQVATRSTNDIGEFRLFGIPPGQYYLSATLQRFQMFEESANQPAYLPTYYPGTGSTAEAQRLAIAAGQVVTGMNMMLLPVRGVRVSGTVVDASGRPLTSGSVMLTQPPLGGPPMFMGSNVKPDGTFSLNNVIPGEYVIRSTIGDAITGDRAMMRIAVAGADLADVAVVAVKASAITGRIVVDRAATAAFKSSDMRLNVSPARPEDEGVTAGVAPAQIKDDLTFRIDAWPGRFVVVGATTSAAGWILDTVRLSGVDVTDTGFDLGASPLTGLEVEVTNNVSEVSGNVLDATGPTRNAWVLVFAQDREKWRAPNRNVVAIRPDPTNLYRARGLRAGAYYAVAVSVESIEPGEWGDPDVLDRVRGRGVAFEVAPGEHKTLNLTLTTFER